MESVFNFGSVREFLHAEEPKKFADVFMEQMDVVSRSDEMRERYDVYIGSMIRRMPWLVNYALRKGQIHSVLRYFDVDEVYVDAEFVEKLIDPLRAESIRVGRIRESISSCISDITKRVTLIGLNEGEFHIVADDLNNFADGVSHLKCFACTFPFERYKDLEGLRNGNVKRFELVNHIDLLAAYHMDDPDRLEFLHDVKVADMIVRGIMLDGNDGLHIGEMVAQNSGLRSLVLDGGIVDGDLFTLNMASRFYDIEGLMVENFMVSESNFADDDFGILLETGFLDSVKNIVLRSCDGLSFESVCNARETLPGVNISFTSASAYN